MFVGVVSGISFNKLINEKDNLPAKLKGERNILLIQLDEDKQKTEGLYAVNISSEDGIIKIVSIPKNIKINVSDEDKSFNRAYTENKTDDIKSSLEKELKIKFNNYICIDKNFIESFYAVTEDINVKIPQDIELNFVKDAIFALCGKNISKSDTDKLMNIIKNVKCDIASYDFEEYAKIFSNIKNADITVKELKGNYEYKEGEMFFYIKEDNIFE